MLVFTVSLFGHRELGSLNEVEELLTPIVKDLIRTKPCVSFLIGRNGEFDIFAASLIKHIQKETGFKNSELCLVLPYMVADLHYYEAYYDSILIPERVQGIHPKSAITSKNQWMIEQSDLVIVYAKRQSGGAYAALKYAEKQNKGVINLCKQGT